MDTTPRPKVGPKDFFLWLGSMAALYVSVVSILALYFQYINYAFPDPLQYYVDPYSSAIRIAIACLIVATPLYIYLTRKINNDVRTVPEKKDLWVRRWLIYITLFIGGLTLAIDMVMLINAFLGGDITTRFVLKVLAVFVVVWAFFWYYLWDLRGVWERRAREAHLLGWLMAAVVVVSIGAGFLITGSPLEQRLYRFDEQKVSDLQNIQWQLVNYWQQKEELPADLSALQDPISGFVLPVDAQTGAQYVYEKTGNTSFKLCATFNKDSRPNGYERAVPVSVPTKPVLDANGVDLNALPWTHGVGEVCFERTIDPERYPPYTK